MKCCANCYHWAGLDPNQQYESHCRAHPPEWKHTDDGDQCLWPITKPIGLCGEWKERE